MPVGPWLAPAISGAVGLIGMGIARGKDRRQLVQQEKLQNLQIRGQQQLLDYSMGKELEMWEKTGYEAQKQQMKNAGINPALLYGMGGGGGQTVGTGNAGTVTGGQAPSGSGRETEEMLGMGIQMALMQSQKRVLDTQADKNAAEAEATGGVRTDLAKTEIQSLTQGIENAKAVQKLTEVQTKIANIDEWIKGRSKSESAEIIMWQAEKILNEVELLHRENIVNKATMNDRIDTVKTELAGKYLSNQLTKAQTTTEQGKPAIQTEEIKVMEQQWKGIIRQGIQKWRELELQGYKTNSDAERQIHEQFINDLQQSTKLPIDVIEKIAQAIIFKNIISPDKPHTPIKGFR